MKGPVCTKHPYHEIFILVEGRSTFTVGSKTFEAGPGQIEVVRPRVAHKFVNSATGRLRQVDVNTSPKFITEWLEA